MILCITYVVYHAKSIVEIVPAKGVSPHMIDNLLILGVWYTMNKVAGSLHLIAQPGGRLEGVRVRGGRPQAPDRRRDRARTYTFPPGSPRGAPPRGSPTP